MATLATQSTPSQERPRQIVWRGRGIATSDGAGVKLTRVIGTHALPDLDPFLMLDEFGSDDPKAYIAGFPDHPHRGFETVTYMLDGRMRHRDSAGNEGLLGPGSVQWMTAARGLVHSEMPEQEHGLMRGFQLWVNLPAADKMGAPRYQDIPPESLPTFDQGKVRGKVIAGEFQNLSSPVERGATAPLYLDLSLDAGGRVSVPLPDEHNAFVYVFDGALDIGGQRLSKGEIGVLSLGDSVTLDASAGSGRALVIAGKPLREPVVKYGPFVMNTRQEIEQAVADFQAGRLQ